MMQQKSVAKINFSKVNCVAKLSCNNTTTGIKFVPKMNKQEITGNKDTDIYVVYCGGIP